MSSYHQYPQIQGEATRPNIIMKVQKQRETENANAMQ